MTYKEKASWLMLVAMVLAYSLYFGLIIAGHPAGTSLFAMLWLFGTIAATQAVVVIISYYVLLTAMIVVGVVMPFTEPAIKIVNTALFGIVLAELVGLIVVVTSYRRGWHG